MANKTQFSEITAEELRKVFLGLTRECIKEGTVTVSGVYINEPVILKRLEIEKYPILIENSVFEEDFVLEGFIYTDIEVKSCQFKGTYNITRLTRSGSQTGKLTISGDTSFEKKVDIRGIDFEISGGNFKNSVSLNGNISSLQIGGGNYFDDIKISAQIGKATINNGAFQKHFIVDGSITNFIIDGGTFSDNFDFQGARVGTLKISNGEFNSRLMLLGGTYNEVDISGGIFKKFIVGGHGKFENDFEISGGQFIETVMITGGVFKGDFKFRPQQFKELEFSSESVFEREVNIWGAALSERAEKVKISIEHPIRLIVHRLDTQLLKLSGSINDSNFLLEHIRISQLIFSDFSNQRNNVIKISNIRPLGIQNRKDQLKIINSSLGNIQFQNCNFEAFNDLTVENSNIIGIETINTTWPKEIHVTEAGEESPEYWSNLREVYRQLKYTMRSQGNKVQELFFSSKEMNAYRKSLSWFSFRTLLDKIVLTIGRFSNNYGQDWLLPIFWLSGISFGTYYLLLITLPISNWDWYKYFVFLNPTHKLDFLGADLKGISLALDFVGRVTISFFIYQIVTAFRKYSTK